MHLRKLKSPIIQMSASFTIFNVFSHTLPVKERMPLRRECKQRTRKEFKALLYKDHCTELEHLSLFLSLLQHRSCCGSALCAVVLCPPCCRGRKHPGEDTSVWHRQQSHRQVCTCLALLMQASVSTNPEQCPLAHTSHKGCRIRPGCSVSLGASRWQCYALHSHPPCTCRGGQSSVACALRHWLP